MPRPLGPVGLRFSVFLVACASNDKNAGPYEWKNNDCPTEEFRAACTDLDQFEGGDQEIFADACEASTPGPACIDGEICVDASCIPEFTDDSASCTAEDTPLDPDLTTRISEVAREVCSGESYGEGTQ